MVYMHDWNNGPLMLIGMKQKTSRYSGSQLKAVFDAIAPASLARYSLAAVNLNHTAP